MNTIKITSRWTGALLFEYECENNTVKCALEKAIADGADLRGANLRGADLRGANLYGADLRGADLRGANLYGADLRGANLRGANLYGADLRGADLRESKLYGTKNADLAIAMTRICPEGDIIGWKKCRNNATVKLKIPAAAKRNNAFGRKCRAEYAEVLEISDTDGNPIAEAVSQRTDDFIYKVGETVHADVYDENFMNECSGGIHFFITREEAEVYDY